HILERHFVDDEGAPKVWYFPQIKNVVEEWLFGQDEYVRLKDGCQVQLLLLSENAYTAAEKLYRAIVAGTGAEEKLRLILSPTAPVGSSATVDFETTKRTRLTNPQKCQVNYVPIDSDWEDRMITALEIMPEVLAYVKNEGMNLCIPYTLEG